MKGRRIKWYWCSDFKDAIGWWRDVNQDLHSDGRGREYLARIDYWWVGGCALGINYAQGFDIYVDLHSIDVDDIAPPIVWLSDAKCHASLLSNCLFDNSLHFGVNEIISFQKLVRNLDDY